MLFFTEWLQYLGLFSLQNSIKTGLNTKEFGSIMALPL